MVSDVIDPVLVEELGFGLVDAVELVLRRVDYVASALAPTWSTREESSRAPARVSESELAAAGGLLGISQQVVSCRHPDRVQLALEHFSTRPEHLVFDSAVGVACFGAMMAVQTNSGGLIPIPAGILVDCLSEIGGVLAEKACQLDPGVEGRWAHKMERGVGYMLAGAGHRVFGPVKTSDGGLAHWAVVYSSSQVLVVDVVAALRRSSLLERTSLGIGSLDRLSVETELIADEGTLPLSPDTRAVTLQVVASPEMAVELPRGGHPLLPMRGFHWLLRTADRRQEDLWYFLRDLSALEGETRLFYGDLFDLWEWWRTGKSFPLAAKAMASFLVVGGGDAPWRAAADDAGVERALLALGLPQVSAWPRFDNVGDSTYVSDLNLGLVYRVLPWSIPVAVLMIDALNPRTPWNSDAPTAATAEDRDTVWYLATGIVERLLDMRDDFHAAAEASGLPSLEIVLVKERAALDRLPSISVGDGPVVVIRWDDRVVQALLDNPVRPWGAPGRILADVFDSPEAKQTFLAGWDAAPPRVRADTVPFPHRALSLPDADRSHGSEVAAVIERLGRHMVAESVGSGTHEGDQAKKLENEIIYPWALAELHRTIAPYNAEQLLMLTMVQLERANHQRLMGRQQLAWRRGFPAPAKKNPLEDELQDVAQLAKAISLVLEETLARPPAGNSPPDGRSWNAILPIAEVAFASCLRSEALHYDLERTRTVIADPFDIHIDHSDNPTDVDMATYKRLRAEATLPEPVPIGSPSTLGPDTVPHDPRPLPERHPELAGIDLALRSDPGFGIDALLGVLEVASGWDATPEEPVTATSLADFADSAVNQIPNTTRYECIRAIRCLTLRAQDLQAGTREYWKTELRPARVETRPFVLYGSNLHVLPWTAGTTLALLGNYLRDGRLPWPRTSLPKSINTALNRYRQAKNKQLERDCYKLLSGTRFETRRNIEPGRAARIVGIDSLSGEIDLLTVDAKKSHIWVIEVKDPYIPFSISQTRHSIDRFHDRGGHIDKLLPKLEDVRRNTNSVASAFGIERDADRDWTVRALMVTRHVHPSAFKIDSRVSFCTIDNLINTVHSVEICWPCAETWDGGVKSLDRG